MTAASAGLAVSTDLLDRAVAYTRGALSDVRPRLLGAPTPCAGWDLLALLTHMDDAMAAMHEAVVDREVPLDPVLPRTGLAPLDSLRDRACSLLAGWSRVGRESLVLVGGRPVPTGVVALTGSLEIALHGWDVAQSVGSCRPLPEQLARELLPAAGALIEDGDRGVRFGPALTPREGASAAEQLLAYAGRSASAGAARGAEQRPGDLPADHGAG